MCSVIGSHVSIILVSGTQISHYTTSQINFKLPIIYNLPVAERFNAPSVTASPSKDALSPKRKEYHPTQHAANYAAKQKAVEHGHTSRIAAF